MEEKEIGREQRQRLSKPVSLAVECVLEKRTSLRGTHGALHSNRRNDDRRYPGFGIPP